MNPETEFVDVKSIGAFLVEHKDANVIQFGNHYLIFCCITKLGNDF